MNLSNVVFFKKKFKKVIQMETLLALMDGATMT